MKKSLRALSLMIFTSLLAVACGGGGGGGSDSTGRSNGNPPPVAGAPDSTGNTAADGFAWINFRRAGAGMAPLTLNGDIVEAAQNHSDYQRLNGPFNDGDGSGFSPITHSETSGRSGFTGTDACPDRITAAGFTLDPQQGYGCGEVISALSTSSGFVAAEELIAAIYHRFIILQPSFRFGGAGSSRSSDGRYTIFTENVAVRGSFTALGSGNFLVYPYSGQTLVPTGFDHSTEAPDPLPPSQYPDLVDVTVGYPVSVHADLDQRIDVTSFTLRPQGGGSPLEARLLSAATDPETQPFSAAIVPLRQLSPNTTYVAEYSGTICDVNWATDQCASNPAPVSRTWSFTTQ